VPRVRAKPTVEACLEDIKADYFPMFRLGQNRPIAFLVLRLRIRIAATARCRSISRCKEARLVEAGFEAENHYGLVVADANVTVVPVSISDQLCSLTYVNIVDVLLKAVSECDAKIEAAPPVIIEGCNN
jgi:hypothetical protein